MAKYTQGEWVADIRVGCVAVHVNDREKFNCLDGIQDQCIMYKGGYQVYGNGKFLRWEVNPVDEANAHLIAAAPDMYEILKILVEQLNEVGSVSLGDLSIAVKALNKAEGK